MERRGSVVDAERSSSRERRERKEKKEKKEKKDKGSRHGTPILASPSDRSDKKERRGSRRERDAPAGEERPIRIVRPQNTPAKDLWTLPSSDLLARSDDLMRQMVRELNREP